MKKRIIILGAGLAGLSTAYFLKKRKIKARIFEKENVYGGLCRSHKKDGFTFDFSGHLLHFRNPETLSLVKKLLKNNLLKHKRNAWIYAFDRFIPFPFQTNFYKLDKRIVEECLKGMKKAHNEESTLSKNDSFLHWINSKFGTGIAKHFLIPYNLKFWTVPLNQIRYKGWADRFIVTSSLKNITNGSSRTNSQNLGYSASFWYPRRGGIGQLTKAFADNIENKDIALNHEAVSIDLDKKRVKFKNGSTESFDALVSTIPLPELGNVVKGLPKSISSKFKKLRWVSIYNVNFGIKNPTERRRHWVYFPGKDISFFRIGFYHNFSSSVAPRGKGALYVELSYSKNSRISKQNILPKIKKDLQKVGIIDNPGQICCEDINNLEYGYPIYDKDYYHAKADILRVLEKHNIISCGRYGSWNYFSMEDVILQSKKVTNGLAKKS